MQTGTRWRAVVVGSVLAATVTACGDPNAGDAAEDEFAAWLVDHPVAGYQPEVRGSNDLPFAGSLYVVMKATESGLAPARFAEEVAAVAAQVCTFEPEASVSVEYAFAVGDFSVPMACPGESDAMARVDDQAALLADLTAIRGVESIEYGFSGSFEVEASPGAGLRKVRTRVETVAGRHQVALDDDKTYVSVSRPIDPTPTSPGS